MNTGTDTQNPRMLGFFSILCCIAGFISMILNSVQLIAEGPSWPLYFLALVFFSVGFLFAVFIVFGSNADPHAKITMAIITIVIALILMKYTLALDGNNDLIKIMNALAGGIIIINLLMGALLAFFGDIGLTKIKR